MYILPLIIIQSWESQLVKKVCYGISAFTLASRLMIEMVQVWAERKNYFKSFWNLNDVSQIIVFTVVTIFDLQVTYNRTPSLILLKVVMIC